MKYILLFLTLVFCYMDLRSQEGTVSLSGGYVLTNLREVKENATGFRINGTYEFMPEGSKVAQGFTICYLNTAASSTEDSQTINYKFTHFPVCYAPKLYFGKGSSVKGFVKCSLGLHYSGYQATSPVKDYSSWDWGFYGGLSGGAMKSFGESFIIFLEYEWAYLSNSYYRDGFVHSFMVGTGYKF